MSKTKNTYIATKVRVAEKSLYRILSAQKKELTEMLDSLEEKRYTKADAILDAQLRLLFAGWKEEIPSYLVTALPSVMVAGAKPTIQKYKKLLPQDYTLSFDIDTSPAVQYLEALETLHLSDRDGSIALTTNNEVRKLIADGVSNGLSYGQIAVQIHTVEPSIFSKSRANLIATQEMGNAYGWANYEPAREMGRQGYLLEKKWKTTEDGKVRPSHTANAAQGWIPMSEAFGTGDEYAPSSRHFRCRCTSSTRIVGRKKNGKNLFFEDAQWCVTRKMLGGEVVGVASPLSVASHSFLLSAKGSLRIKAPDGSQSDDIDLIWPQGDKWEKGDNGADGKDGKDGKDGEPWIQGEKGERGDDGADGKDGIDGKDGKDGVAGNDGKDGKDGKQGEKWEKGEKGEKGERGEKGEKWEKGERGYNGMSIEWPKGDKGDRGDIWPQWLQGIQGEVGPQGITWPQWPIWPVWPVWPVWPQGMQWIQWPIGLQGIQGFGCVVGMLAPYAGATAPTGWLLCQGQAVSRTTYSALFAVCNTTYGSGDGSTTFNLPDLRGRAPYGKANSGTGSVLGASGGQYDHTHIIDPPATQGAGTSSGISLPIPWVVTIFTSPVTVDIPPFPSQSANPPYIVLNYIIFSGI